MGIGTDIVEIDRIKTAKERSGFLERILNESEINYLKQRNLRDEYVAGRFAAKEAVAKALGTGFREFGFTDIIINNDSLGKPMVELFGKAKKIASDYGVYKIHLSISHAQNYATAFAILEVE